MEVLKKIVQEKYAVIANQEKMVNSSSCCGATICSTEVYNIMNDSYENIDGYIADADLGLGCGLPTEHAKLLEGQTVVDLGSGAGNDCFVARKIVGEKGRVIGVDFTEAMIEKAISNANTLGFTNVEFVYGDIENIPLAANTADVVVSNCVLNLVPNKKQVFNEIFRILKPGAHFSISDIVLVGILPTALQKDAEMYAGCVSGAIQKNEYLQHITEAGFGNIIIQKEKAISIPTNILEKYLTDTALEQFGSNTGIYSITVYAEKNKSAICNGNNCC